MVAGPTWSQPLHSVRAHSALWAEEDIFADSKMDNFSLIIDWLNFLKTDWNVFYVNAKQGSIFKS